MTATLVKAGPAGPTGSVGPPGSSGDPIAAAVAFGKVAGLKWSPTRVKVAQGPTDPGQLAAHVTWPMDDPDATKFEVLRDGAVVATIGPFVPYDPTMTRTGGPLAALGKFRGTAASPEWDITVDYALGDSVYWNAAHWLASGNPAVGDQPGVAATWTKVYDDTAKKCYWLDTNVVAGRTYSYAVRAYFGSTAGVSWYPTKITIRSDAQLGNGTITSMPAPTGDDSDACEAAYAAGYATGSRIFKFQAGTYAFRRKFSVASDALLRGTGTTDSDTILTYHASYLGGNVAVAPLTGTTLIEFTGGEINVATSLSSPASIGDRVLKVPDASSVREGQTIYVTQTTTMGEQPPVNVARGDLVTPELGYSEQDRWEALCVESVGTGTIKFVRPMTQPQKTSNVVVRRLAEPTIGAPLRGGGIELMTVQGRDATNATEAFQLVSVQQTVDWQAAKVRWRWANMHAIVTRTCRDVRVVDCHEPDHGAATPTIDQQGYTYNINRCADFFAVACTVGTQGSMKVVSPFTIQRSPMALVRSCTVYWSREYGANEHGSAGRDWCFENCTFYLGTNIKRAAVFVGNNGISHSARGIVRNNTVFGGPALVDGQENSYGVQVLWNRHYCMAPSSNSPTAAGIRPYGWGSPQASSSKWGTVMWVVRRNAWFGGTGDHFDYGWQSSAFYPINGIRGIVHEDNHHDVSGTGRLRGTRDTTTDYQVRRNTGNPNYSHPPFGQGVHWEGNADTSPTSFDWGPDEFTAIDADYILLKSTVSKVNDLALSGTNSGASGKSIRVQIFSSATTTERGQVNRPQLAEDGTVKTLAKFATGVDREYRVHMRAGGSSATDDAYWFGIRNYGTNRLRLGKTISGADSVIAQSTAFDAHTGDIYLLAGIAGQTLNARAWAASGSDPGTYSAPFAGVSDTSITARGQWGVTGLGNPRTINGVDQGSGSTLSLDFDQLEIHASATAQATIGAAYPVDWDNAFFETIGGYPQVALPAGPTGPAGPPATNMGTWSSATNYPKAVIVDHLGSSYFSLVASQNKTPASNLGTYWQLIASKGDTGATGTTGTTGATGPAGPQGTVAVATATPLRGTLGGAVGTGTDAARSDHQHPVDGLWRSPTFASGGYYADPGTAGTTAIGLNTVRLRPFLITEPVTLAALNVEPTTAVAGALARGLIYSSDTAGRPNALIADTGQVSIAAAATTDLALSPNVTLQPGLYFFGAVKQGSNDVTLRAVTTASPLPLWSSTATGNVTPVAYNLNTITGTPPSTISTASLSIQSAAFRVSIKVA